MNHDKFLDAACEEARNGLQGGGVGAGAVLVKEGVIVARTHDRTRQLNDPVAVAEVDCIRRAGRRSDQRALTLYSTRYPDMLCTGTILQFSIGSLVIGLAEKDTAELALLAQKKVPVSFVPHTGCRELARQ